MKRQLISICKEILIILMNHWVFALAAITIMAIFRGEEPLVALWLGLGMVPVVFYGIRETVKKFFRFFLLHLAVLVAAVLVPIPILPRVLLILITAVYLILSVRVRVLEGVQGVEQFHPIFMVAAMAVMSLAFQKFAVLPWQGFYMIACLIYLFTYFVVYFLAAYERFLMFNTASASNLPKREVFYSGMKQTMLFTAGSIGLLALVANIKGLAEVGKWIRSGLLLLLKWIVSLLPGQEEVPEEIPEAVVESAGQGGMGELMEAAEAGKFWVILQEIFFVLVTVGSILLVLYGLVKFCVYLWKRFHMQTDSGDHILSSVLDIRENCGVEQTRREKGGFHLFKTPREKVRHIFRTRVLRRKAEILGARPEEDLVYLTAKESLEKIEANPLRMVYEKARYSDEEITAEDVRLAKR